MTATDDGAPYAPTRQICARCQGCDCPEMLVGVDPDGTEHFVLQCSITRDCVGLFFSTAGEEGPLCNRCTIAAARGVEPPGTAEGHER